MALADRLRALVEEMLSGRAEVPSEPGDRKGEALAVDAWRQRLSWATRISRVLGVRGHDRLTAVGEQVHVPVPTDRFRALRASRLQVRVADAVVHEGPAATAPEHVLVQPQRAGLFEVQTEWQDAQGATIHPLFRVAPAYLQVAHEKPIVGIDAALLFERPEAAQRLRAVARRGFEIFYFDTVGEDRAGEIHELMARTGAPAAAVLAHAEREVDVRTWGVDFRAVFLTITFRRLRGSGVPLVGVVSAGPDAAMAARRCELELLDPNAEPGQWWSASWSEAARGFLSAPASSPLQRRLDRMTSTRSTPGNACRVEMDNARARGRLLELVDGAEHEVHLQFYMVRAGAFADRLGAHLVRSARRGARVRLLVDALYSLDGVAGTSNAVVRGLSLEPGIEVVASSPILSRADIEPLMLKRRDHRKLVLVDGRVALVGGRNCADEYWTGFDEVAVADWTVHDRIPWFDAHVEVQGPLVPRVEEAFRAAWVQAGGASYPVSKDPAEPAGPVDARLVLHDGVWDAAAMLAYEALIDGATQHVYVVNDFPIVQSLRAALLRALARGVKVRLLTGSAVARRSDGTFFEGPLHRQAFEYMTKQRIEDLLRAGAEAFEVVAPPHPLIVCRGGRVRPYVHAKIVTADGLVASVGSANLDATASYWEREANVVVENAGLVGELERSLQALCEAGHPVDLESDEWRRDRILRELAAQLWPEALYG